MLVMTPAEFAAEWGFREDVVRRKAREIGACRILGKVMRFTDDDVAALRLALDPVFRAAKGGIHDLPELQRGFVYFVECQGRVKIGFARDVGRRIAALQKACPFELKLMATFPGSIPDEWTLHERFAASRIHGEWFNLSSAIKDFIASLQE